MKVGDVVMVWKTDYECAPGVILAEGKTWFDVATAAWKQGRIHKAGIYPLARPATCAELRAFGVRCEHEAGRRE